MLNAVKHLAIKCEELCTPFSTQILRLWLRMT